MKIIYLIATIAMISMAGNAIAQTTPNMQVATDKDIYQQGDSIEWQCALNGFGKNYKTVTLQLYIENLQTKTKWHFRFPIINGYNDGAIKIANTLPSGRYAFNFMLQGDFFNVAGQLLDHKAKDSVLNYFALFKDKETIVNTAKVGPEGFFKIRGIVYEDTAMFTFSKPGKTNDVPSMKIATSLDSTFEPVLPVVTKFIVIGADVISKDTAVNIAATSGYTFNIEDTKSHALQEVVIMDRRGNKVLKDYEDDYVTPMFKTADDITLDGLSNDDMMKTGNIYNYLMMHVPGLKVTMNPETGLNEIVWRNMTPAIYIDEFRLPDEIPISVPPGQIAMIKVYRPGNGPLTGGNNSSGAIAIYTKVGKYAQFSPDSGNQNRFFVRGYDGRSIEWNY